MTQYYETVWMDWTTLKGVTATPRWFLPEALWLDAQDHPSLVVRTDVIEVTGSPTLMVATAPSAAGDWEGIGLYTGLTRAAIVCGTEPNSSVSIQRYLAAGVEGSGAPWSITFRLLLATPYNVVAVDRERSVARSRSSVVVPTTRTAARSAGQEPQSKTGAALLKVPFASTNTPRGTADGYIPVQDWITVQGGATLSDPDDFVIQCESGWIDTRSSRYLLVESEVAAISNASVVVETAFTKEGPWVQVGSALTTAYDVHPACLTVEYAAFSASTLNAVRCWLRWHIESSTDDWEACFRINAKWA